MLITCDRAFKEWDVSCRALMDGKQTLLIRKGGIDEDGGRFVIKDSEFWLMPTFDHQTPALLQPEYAGLLPVAVTETDTSPVPVTVPAPLRIQTYAIVDGIWEAKDDEQVNAFRHEMIWNEKYVAMRFNFNPYDPLYLILLRVYRLREPIIIPQLKAYGGCKSWVTLDQSLPTVELEPVISDSEFITRRRQFSELQNSL
jgi:hypothetical protein